MNDIWKNLDFESSKTANFHIGQLQCWIQIKRDEVWVAYQYTDKDIASPDDLSQPPENLEWARWALKNEVSSLSVVPVLPDLPVMVYPEYPLKIVADAKIRIFTRVALWVRIQTNEKKPVVICEIPTIIASKTWFGTRYDGELCYAATTKTRRVFSPDTYKPHLVNCAITIQNRSDKYLDFQSFCFRVGRLNVYRKGDELWSNETHILFEGEDQLSNVNISNDLPIEAKGGQLLTEARQKTNQNIATRTFHKIIKEIGTLAR